MNPMDHEPLRPAALIIDDQENWRELLSRICRDLRFSATSVETLEQARDALDSSPFKVVILDMIPLDEDKASKQVQGPLPVDVFLAHLRSNYANTPIFLFSGSMTVHERAVNLMQKGANVMALRKNVSAQDIFDCLKKLTGISDISGVEHAADIFVVYGHDHAARESVQRMIEKLGLRAVILPEQVIEGKTIIESIESDTNAGFVVVLLTPDDEGHLKGGADALQGRARQNVIFELGFCIGKLGRPKVCALYKDDTELPSDFNGMRFIKMDPDGAWKLTLGKEIKSALKKAGIDVDLNKLV